MKSFLKFTLASVIGFIIAFVLIVVLANVLVLNLISKIQEKEEVHVEENSVLRIELDYPVQERSPEDPFENFDFTSFEPQKSLGLNQILAGIERAKNDDRVKGIYLHMKLLQMGTATAGEIRDALIDFKESGKFVAAYSELMSQKAYYIASAADEIYLNPTGLMEFNGMSTQVIYFTKTLEKLGIEPQIFYNGKFKSATEPFRLTEMSEANRQQTEELLNEVYQHFLMNISEARGVSVSALDSIASNMLVRESEDAVKYKLINALAYEDEVRDTIRRKLNLEKEDEINFIQIEKYAKEAGSKGSEHYKKSKVAVLYAAGVIKDGSSSSGYIGSETMSKVIREIREDSSIAAVVVRINSPGGSALASDVIWRELLETKKVKPVIASMGDMAASGGYYIACVADTIVAEATTLTGSIGVFAIWPNMQDFFEDKLGLRFDGVKTGKMADFGEINRPLRPEEKEIFQLQVNKIYRDFLSRVAEGRGMTVEEVDSIAQGRVWTGSQAKAIGLVDLTGSFEDAVALAARKAGLEDYRVAEYPKRKDPLKKLMETFTTEARAKIAERELGDLYHYYKYWKEITQPGTVQARIPYIVEIW